MPPPPKLSAAKRARNEVRRRAFFDSFSHIFWERHGIRLADLQLYQPFQILSKMLVASPLTEDRLRILFEHKLPPVYRAVACVLQVLNNGSFEDITQAEFFTHEFREMLNWMYYATQQVPSEWDKELDLEWLILPDVSLPPFLHPNRFLVKRLSFPDQLPNAPASRHLGELSLLPRRP